MADKQAHLKFNVVIEITSDTLLTPNGLQEMMVAAKSRAHVILELGHAVVEGNQVVDVAGKCSYRMTILPPGVGLPMQQAAPNIADILKKVRP